MSPAQAHQARVLAQLAAAATPAGEQVQGDAYRLMLAQLVEHRRALKGIQSMERKIDLKRTLLPEYDAWIDGVLEAGNGAQDQVLTTVMVWHIDVGNHARALQIARYVMRHGLDTPDQYERSAAVVLIDEFAAAALAGKMAPALAEQILPMVQDLTAEHDAPDQARAKLHKAIGYALIGRVGSAEVDLAKLAAERCSLALVELRRALELHEQCGVKKDIERLERRLRPAAAAPAPAPAPAPTEAPTAVAA